jgi:hypothetical protein
MRARPESPVPNCREVFSRKSRLPAARRPSRLGREMPRSRMSSPLWAVHSTWIIRSSIDLEMRLYGTHVGRLSRVLTRILEGYNFVLKTDNGRIVVTVVGARRG